MATELTPIEELDRNILNLCYRINSATCELLVLIREFDERGGWLKWGMKIAPSGWPGVVTSA